jgi:proteasome accessory factor B
MPLSLAIETGQVVEFQYRKPGASKPEKRLVQPWRLQNVSGQWLLVSLDQDKQEVRNFLLKRIVSKITPTGEVFDKPTQVQITGAVADLDQLVERQVASLRIKPDTVAWNYFEMDLPRAETDNVHHLNYMDEGILAEKLRSFGTDLEVIRPASLASAIRSGLEKVVNDHA